MSNELKNKLDQEPLEFDTSMAWEQLSPKLESTKRKRRGFIWWWLGGSAGAIMLALTAFYFYPSTSVQADEVVQRTERENVVSSDSSVLPKGDKSTNQDETRLGASIADNEKVNSAPSVSVENVSSDFDDVSLHNLKDLRADVGGIQSADSQVDIAASAVMRQSESASRPFVNERTSSRNSGKISQEEVAGQLSSSAGNLRQSDSHSVDENSALLPRIENDLRAKTDGNRTMAQKEVSFRALALLGLPMLEIQDVEKLGPISFVKPGSSIPYGKLSTKPYWQVGVLAGVGYERLTSKDTDFAERSELEVRNLQLNVTRSFSKRFAVSAHAQLGQRVELYSTDFTQEFEETVFNDAALLVGGERFGDSVTVMSAERLQSERYAKFTRLNVGATVEYLIPTQFCDYAIYGGVNYALLQRWSGSRMVQPEPTGNVIEDLNGPYDLTAYPSRFSYIVGARVSKPLGRQLQLMFDSRIVLASQYRLLSDGGFPITEQGHSATVSLGLGWRFD